jgi:shikimate dehydrogenase
MLFDVVYDPWPTPLAVAWEKRGGGVTSGLDLLVHQAVGQLKLMTGHHVPAHVLFAAIR